MTEPMKTEGAILREKLGDKYINEQAIRYAVYNAMREYAAQQVAAERERIKSYLKSELNETYDGYRHSTLSKVFELIDSL